MAIFEALSVEVTGSFLGLQQALDNFGVTQFLYVVSSSGRSAMEAGPGFAVSYASLNYGVAVLIVLRRRRWWWWCWSVACGWRHPSCSPSCISLSTGTPSLHDTLSTCENYELEGQKRLARGNGNFLAKLGSAAKPRSEEWV